MDVLPDRKEVRWRHVYNAKKTQLLLDAIEENFGECILYTDIDLQFFEHTSEIVHEQLKNNDLVFQREFFEGKSGRRTSIWDLRQ